MAPLLWGMPSLEIRQNFARLRPLKYLLKLPLSRATIPLLYLLAPGLILPYSWTSYFVDMIRSTSNPNFKDPFHYDTFDFIVVGAGSAGAVVANRLSKFHRVLLLEAGGNPHPLAILPVATPILVNQPTVDWLYQTVPQRNSSFAFKGHRLNWPRGKSLGGSSTLNSMIYMRGNPNDFDQWARLTGDPEWSYENLLPFFKKLETYKGHYPNDKDHGQEGPIYVEQARFTKGTKEWFLAGQEMGFVVRDQNAGQSQGFSGLDVTMKRGTRFGTYRAYLKPIRGRKNLIIHRYALAFKVHLDKRRNAYGVSYFRHGVQKFARANKEVIISGGTVNSPHLLMLSGIGPKKHLNSKGIKCRVNLPTGQNLHDHLVVNVGPILIEKPLSVISDRDVSIQSIIDFLINGTGPLVTITGISSTAFIASSFATPSWPDLLLFQIGAGVHRSLGSDQEQSLNYKIGILTQFYKPSVGRDANFVILMLGKPKSRGGLYLKDNYPYSKPILDPRYLSHPHDSEALLQGVKFIINLYQNTRTYQNIGAKFASNSFPGCESHVFMSDDYWKCYIKFNSFTLHHQCGTVRMGKSKNDPLAVVDSKLRVLKTRGLRVIDASVMPEITNANLNIPTIMIGEKGAADIRNHWAEQFLISLGTEYYLTHPKNNDRKCFYSQHA